MFKEKIKPPLVLTLICIITCGLLVAAYEATYVDTAGVITDKLIGGLTEVYGSADGFEMLKNEDGSVMTREGVTSILFDGENTAFEITADGYSSGGLHVLVGLDKNGAVRGVSVMTISETPNVGTKVQNESFRSQFIGVSYEDTVSTQTESIGKAKAVWGTRDEINRLQMEAQLNNTSSGGFELDTISGATFSSNGMYSAVKTALAAYGQMGMDTYFSPALGHKENPIDLTVEEMKGADE